MGIIETKNSMCTKMVDGFDGISSSITSASNTIKSSISKATKLLDSMSSTPTAILNAAISDFESYVNGNMPSFEDASLDEIINIINQCSFFGDDSSLNNPITMVNGLVGSAQKGLLGKINEISDSIPEFKAGSMLNEIMNQFSSMGSVGGSGLSEGMGKLDGAINCVNSLCPGFSSSVTKMVDKVNGLYSNLGMVSNPLSPDFGKLDVDAIYTSAGIGPDKISAMNNTIGSMTTMTSNVQTTISAGVDVMKNYVNIAL
jgi:hypothetical protein